MFCSFPFYFVTVKKTINKKIQQTCQKQIPMNKRLLLRFYRKVLFHENANPELGSSIREAMHQIRTHGLDDIDAIIYRMRKQHSLMQNQRLKSRLRSQIQSLTSMMEFSSSSSSSSEVESACSNDSTSDESDKEPRYKVHRIMGFRLSGENNHRQYLVRWRGYGPDDDTWEPIDRLMEDQCGDLVANFHKEHMRFN